MKADLTALLLGLPDLAAQVGTRIHWNALPDGVSALPYVTLQHIGGPGVYTIDGDTGLHDDLVQADIWAAGDAQASAIRGSLSAALSGWRGTQGATVFRSIRLAGSRDLDGRGLGRQETIFGASLDLAIRWRAAA